MIIASMGPIDMVLINPRIIQKSGAFDTEEGCLSLNGERLVPAMNKSQSSI